jgi:hypothetical protein
MKNFQTKNIMRKNKSHPVADQFSDHEMDRVMRYGQALGGSPTPFDEEVEKHLRKIEESKKRVRPPTSGSGQAAGHDTAGG